MAHLILLTPVLRMIRFRWLARCIVGLGLCCLVAEVDAGVVGRIGQTSLDQNQQTVSVSLFIAAEADLINDELELINLDVQRSRFNGQSLDRYTRFRFDAASPFNEWGMSGPFGSRANYESQIVLDAFSESDSFPSTFLDTGEMFLGTLHFDYSGLRTGGNDRLEINLLGVDDAMSSSGTRTTSVAVFDADFGLGPSKMSIGGMGGSQLFNIQWSNSGSTTVSFQSGNNVVPEPGSTTLVSLAMLGVAGVRRRRRVAKLAT